MSEDNRLFPVKNRSSSLYLSGYKKRIGRRGVKMCREVLERSSQPTDKAKARESTSSPQETNQV